MRRKGRVAYNGVDVVRIEGHRDARRDVRASLGAADGAIVIGTAARLVTQKNLHRVIDAFAAAQPRLPPGTLLVILGDGPLRGDLEALISRHGLERMIVLAGAVSRDEVYRHLHAFDRYVMLSSWEGFCNAAVEAVIAGLPVLASDIVTLREVLGNDAYYADPSSIESMAAGFLRLVDAPPTPEALELARADFSARYSIERACDDYERVYAELS